MAPTEPSPSEPCPPEPSPADDALALLGKLAAAGAPPARVTQAVGEIVAGWAGEPDMDAGAAQARIERLWDSLGKDAADLQESISDAPEGGGPGAAQALTAARRTLAALNAAITALAAAHERL